MATDNIKSVGNSSEFDSISAPSSDLVIQKLAN